jgi:hypothetical protein
MQLPQTIFDESIESKGLHLPHYQNLNMSDFYFQLQLYAEG